MNSNLDMNRLTKDLREIAFECRRHKDALGATWTGPMGDVQRALGRARRRATELCVLRASLRGRLHVTRPPRGAPETWDREAFRRAVADRVARDYASPPVTEARAP